MRPYYYILDENNNPVVSDDREQWGHWQNAERRRVASTDIGDAHISTVFLSIDHQFGDGPPLLFETMVFGGPLDHEQERYSTWAEAVAGHKSVVERVKQEARIVDAAIEDVVRPG